MAAYYLIRNALVENIVEWDGVRLYVLQSGYSVAKVSDGLPNGVTIPSAPAVVNSVISLADFFRRFTPAELAGIQASADTTVQQHLLVLKSVMFLQIDLFDSHTVTMLTYLATHPGGSPLLTPARATIIGTP